jgi:hypothetical protein
MPYVRRPGHFMSDVKYSHVVNDLARRMINALSTELPWVLAALPRGVYSVCDRALVTINFASALHRDRRDKVSTHTGPPYMSLVSLAYSLSLSLSLLLSLFLFSSLQLSAPAQQQVDDMLQELREKANLSALESILMRFATMLSPAASAPTGCAWQLRAPKGWEIRTAFIYPGGCVSEHFVADPVS